MGKPEKVAFDHMRIRIKLRGKTFDRDLSKELSINPKDLERSFLTQADSMGWWGTLKALVDGELRERKRIFEKRKEKLSRVLTEKIRDEEGSSTRITKAELERRMSLLSDYNKWLRQLNQLKEYADYLKACVEALVHRRDSLKGINYERNRKANVFEEE